MKMDLGVDLFLQIILSLDRRWIKAPDVLLIIWVYASNKCWLKGSDSFGQVVSRHEGLSVNELIPAAQPHVVPFITCVISHSRSLNCGIFIHLCSDIRNMLRWNPAPILMVSKPFFMINSIFMPWQKLSQGFETNLEVADKFPNPPKSNKQSTIVSKV